ncbi:MAG: HD domain-containing protein [Spirochaetaceae bacterium]|jgi:HD superfamily phosphohydrolase|nr:HD domain-containing protein [Spirochaetaceae bacterium]
MDISFFDTDNSSKILRDLVHGYIGLSEFDLKIIDTPHFQRLKDVRQLTAQHVYPDARHTRFEHSLGVMELTRQAIKHINENKFLSAAPEEMKNIIDKNGGRIIDKYLELNTSLAALLHDVGHCPFSHLGERQFEDDDDDTDKPIENLRNEMIIVMREKKLNLEESEDLIKAVKEHKTPHELLSCIIILKVYHLYWLIIKRALTKALGELNGHDGQVGKTASDKKRDAAKKTETEKKKERLTKPLKKLDAIDFGFIVRCILGIPYKDTSRPEISLRNIMIGLINSDALDMDKLDYIMRDAFYTGINVPAIDTKRLFKNMYISMRYELVYTSKAVPVLQNIIESRDSLYLWVYNHHTVVYTDFLYYYIFRRLHHNAVNYEKKKNVNPKSGSKTEKNSDPAMNSTAGMMKREMLFSSKAIKYWLVSDSSLHYQLLCSYRNLGLVIQSKKHPLGKEEKRVYFLLWHLFRRELLKPWWKTIFEYENFMNSRISDDKIRTAITQRICSDTDGIRAAEFRSQIAKGVILLSEVFQKKLGKSLKDGDFFIVERSNRFYTLRAIENFTVYLKKNEFADPNQENLHTEENEYFGKLLSKLLPQKNYNDFFTKASFYLYTRPYENISPEGKIFAKGENFFYEKIEKLFVSVSTCLASMTKAQFVNYCNEYKRAVEKDEIPKTLLRVKQNLELNFPFYDGGNENGNEGEIH